MSGGVTYILVYGGCLALVGFLVATAAVLYVYGRRKERRRS